MSSYPKADSSSKFKDATDGVSNDYVNPLSYGSSSNKEELKEKDSTDSVDPLSPKDSFSSFFAERVHKALPPFPYMLKNIDQAPIDKMRDTFSQAWLRELDRTGWFNRLNRKPVGVTVRKFFKTALAIKPGKTGESWLDRLTGPPAVGPAFPNFL